jgi:hypothetical protein
MRSVATLALDFLVQADDGGVQGIALPTHLADRWKFPRVEHLPQTVPVDLSLCRSIVYVPGTYGLASVLIVFWMVVVALCGTPYHTALAGLWLEYSRSSCSGSMIVIAAAYDAPDLAGSEPKRS